MAIRAVVVNAIKSDNKLRAQVVGVVTDEFDPGNIANNTMSPVRTYTVTGAQFGDMVDVSASVDLQGLMPNAWISAANTVSVRLLNLTGSGVNLPNTIFKILVRRLVVLEPLTKQAVRAILLGDLDAGDADDWED